MVKGAFLLKIVSPVILNVLVQFPELLQLHDDGADRDDEEQEERVYPADASMHMYMI